MAGDQAGTGCVLHNT